MRLSCHKLQIEIGRYGSDRLKPEERICKLCTLNQCEDEEHFVIRCPIYIIQRNTYFSILLKKYPSFANLDDNCKFRFIMSNADEEVINATGIFISKCFEQRKLETSQVSV